VIARQEGGEKNLLIYDKALTNCVSNTLQHVVDLCGGANHEPF
jgi:hypothetical protein